MLSLPNQISYSVLKSFWAVFCTTTLAVFSLIVVALTGSFAWLFLLLTIPAFIMFGVKYPEKIVKPYAYFNAALRRMLGLMRNIVLFIVHYFILAPLKLNGGRLEFSKGETMWEVKQIVNLIGEKGDYDVSLDHLAKRSSFYSMFKWVIQTRKWWLLTIIPHLFVLSKLSEPMEDIEVASDTYTLY